MEQKKNMSKKTSTICLIVGALLIAIAVGLVVLYATSDLQMQASLFWLISIAFFVGFGGFIALLLGLTPFVRKLTAKLSKETLDYAGDDISKASVKGVQVAKPAIEELGKVIKPIITNERAEEKEEGSENNFCPYCGAKLKGGYEFCPKCGKDI